LKPPPWRNEDAVIEWGVKRFWEIWGDAEDLYGIGTWDPSAFPGMPSRAHEMMIGLVIAEENRKLLLDRKVLPESEAGIREAALSGWTEPLALLIWRHIDPDSGFPQVKHIELETWYLALEFIRGDRNPKTGKPTGRRGPRKKTSAQKRKDVGTHDAADYVPIIRTYLRDAYPKQDRGQIHDLARKIAGGIKGVEPETIAAHQKRGRKRRAR
jgi:hypothetical protein